MRRSGAKRELSTHDVAQTRHGKFSLETSALLASVGEALEQSLAVRKTLPLWLPGALKPNNPCRRRNCCHERFDSLKGPDALRLGLCAVQRSRAAVFVPQGAASCKCRRLESASARSKQLLLTTAGRMAGRSSVCEPLQ
jgi:hypothetical protein